MQNIINIFQPKVVKLRAGQVGGSSAKQRRRIYVPLYHKKNRERRMPRRWPFRVTRRRRRAQSPSRSPCRFAATQEVVECERSHTIAPTPTRTTTRRATTNRTKYFLPKYVSCTQTHARQLPSIQRVSLRLGVGGRGWSSQSCSNSMTSSAEPSNASNGENLETSCGGASNRPRQHDSSQRSWWLQHTDTHRHRWPKR